MESIKSSKRICIITPSIKMGGVERASVNYSNSLSDLGHDVILIALFNQTKFFDLNPRVKFVEPNGFNETSLSFFKSLSWIRKEIVELNPDVVLVLGKFYSALALVSLALTKIPVVISERSSPFYKWPFMIRNFSNLAFKIFPPKAVVCQTQTAKDVQKKIHRKNVELHVIPNPVRLVETYDVPKENIILAVGRFNDPNKGFDRLIDAFALLQYTEDWKLVFAGGDEDGSYLKKQAKELGVLNKIIFEGKSRNVDYHFSKAKIFVIPSRSEGFPNALCEAMAHGLTCVSYDFHCGPRDLISDGINGILIKDGDVKSLAKAIDHLIVNPDFSQNLGKNALEINESLNALSISKKLESIFFK